MLREKEFTSLFQKVTTDQITIRMILNSYSITFALFKRNSRKDVGLNLDEILYKNGYVTLEMLIGDNTLTVKRSQKSPKLDIKLDNEPLYLGLKVPEKEKRIEEIIGYDYEGFTSSFFIRQQELQIFSTLTSSERHERLVKLFKLKIFQNIYKKLKSTINGYLFLSFIQRN